MSTINFVPNDYVQQRQSNRANSLYLILLVAVLGGIGVTFSILKMRQRAVESELNELSIEMEQAKKQIEQLEELKAKSNTRMKVMMMTAALIEPVPSSVLLASLTNNLPGGVSLLQYSMKEEESNQRVRRSPKDKQKSQYQSKKDDKGNESQAVIEQKQINTKLELQGIAPSDIQVANYIANLSNSILLHNVQLVESQEHMIEGIRFRKFKLQAELRPEIKLTKEDIELIRKKRTQTI